MGNKVPTEQDYPEGFPMSAAKGGSQPPAAGNMDMGHGGSSMPGMPGMDMGPISFDCDGKPWTGLGQERPGERWIFICAGILLSVWCLHWTLAIFRRYIRSCMSTRTRFTARATHPIGCSLGDFPLEGALKTGVSFIGILCLQVFTNPRSPRICGPNTQRAGHLSPAALYVSQDTWIMFAFMMSGVIDLLAYYAHLPQNLDHAFLAMAFTVQAFILRKEERVDMLDKMALLLLFYTAAAVTLSLFAEMVFPQSFWPSCARVFSTWMQAIWMFACARMMHEDHKAWRTTDPPDMAPGMFVPVLFVGWMNGMVLILITVFALVRWWCAKHADDYEQVPLRQEPVKANGIQMSKVAA